MASGAVLGTLFGLPQSWFDFATVPTSAGASQDGGAGKEQEDLCAALHSLQTDTTQTTTAASASGWREAGATCVACGIGFNSPGFTTAAEQREHFKTDWHRYNVKRRVNKQPPVAEDEFERLLDASSSEVSSISGSEGSDSTDVDSVRRSKATSVAPPRAMFIAQDGRHFCVWQCLVHRDHVRGHAEPPNATQQLEALQQLRKSPGLFVVLLLRGGHFAAAVFRAKVQKIAGDAARQQGDPKALSTPGAAVSSTTKAADWLEVVAHKTFHRYVVRAKAGGKQSAKDASGKYARSAGAALRRYNEARLDEDIAELLASWRQYLDTASLIFVQAPASNARSVFSASDMAAPVIATDNSRGTSLAAAGAASSRHLINPQDPRVRRIPFATQRPTFTEARRAVGLLLAVFEPTAAALAAQQAAQEAEEAAAEVHLERKLARKARKQASAEAQQEASGSSAGQAGSPAQQQVTDGMEQGPAAQALQETELHTASRSGDHRAVTQLLQQGADPCAKDSRGRTAYAVAADKDVRDAFRRHMAAAPEQWDWTAAGVPSPLTDELQAAQAQRKAEKRARQKEREKERKSVLPEQQQAAHKAAVEDEIARAAAEAAALAAKLNQASGKASSAGKKVGSMPPAAQARAAHGVAGNRTAAAAPLTAEEMARRREQMAAAAEARMRALQQASGQQRLY